MHATTALRQLIEKLVHDNEILMKEVADLDAQLRQAVEERDAAVSSLKTMQDERQGAEATNELSERLVRTMETQAAAVRAEREELARQHAEDRQFLNGIFTELEAQLQLARTEREEANARAERERRTSSKRIRELEEALSAAHASKDRMREASEREKEVLAKQFEQRVAGLRLEKEQAKLDKASALPSAAVPTPGPRSRGPYLPLLPRPHPLPYPPLWAAGPLGMPSPEPFSSLLAPPPRCPGGSRSCAGLRRSLARSASYPRRSLAREVANSAHPRTRQSAPSVAAA